MHDIGNIDFYDFYYNGHYLSEFGGIVGGSERLSNYPLLPSRQYVTDRAIGQDGATVFDSYLEPRKFEVPVFFEQIDYAGLRNIASWLNTKEPVDFYYKNDTLKISCVLDSAGTDLASIAGEDGQTSLKFIAHDPFYYQLEEDELSYDNLSGSFAVDLENLGNVECYPQIEIIGTGDITVTCSDSDGNVLTTCTVSDVTSGCVIDGIYHTLTLASGANWINLFDGAFPIFPVGNFHLDITSSENNLIRVNISPRYRFI